MTDKSTPRPIERRVTAWPIGESMEMSFAVVGPRGAVELRLVIGSPGQDRAALDTWGFEQHEAVEPGASAAHDECWLLRGPCNHDGTSLWAREHWLPNFKRGGTDWLWPALERAYDERLPARAALALAKEPTS